MSYSFLINKSFNYAYKVDSTNATIVARMLTQVQFADNQIGILVCREWYDDAADPQDQIQNFRIQVLRRIGLVLIESTWLLPTPLSLQTTAGVCHLPVTTPWKRRRNFINVKT